jgi:hypothetical protein
MVSMVSYDIPRLINIHRLIKGKIKTKERILMKLISYFSMDKYYYNKIQVSTL